MFYIGNACGLPSPNLLTKAIAYNEFDSPEILILWLQLSDYV
ncbi:MAG: hypothetical protein VKL42_06125 [Snowella sp.]|nr:hypothetical protein [Snowella sp.]